jgi:hypothetical protein
LYSRTTVTGIGKSDFIFAEISINVRLAKAELFCAGMNEDLMWREFVSFLGDVLSLFDQTAARRG